MAAKYQVVEATDLRARIKSYKIYERKGKGLALVMAGFATRAEAEAKLHELEAAETQ